jgi:GDP-L-fucose synthase
MNKTDKIYVAGHKGLIGSAIVRRLLKDGYTNIIVRGHDELDLTDQLQVKVFFERERPDYVFFAAAKVGGIFANKTYRADLLYENVLMQSNVIHPAFLYEVKKLLFFGCADVYPKNCLVLAKEEDLLAGPLESTSEPFAVAKIAGIKACESYNRQYGTDFITVIPTNVYGPNQHYDVMNAQVVPSLIKRFHDAKVSNSREIVVWGSGSPVRDFLFVDDLGDACMLLMNTDTDGNLFNIGSGKGFATRELAETIKKAVGFEGKIVFDTTKPDGVPVKLLDVSKIKSRGWEPRTTLFDGIKLTYDAFLGEVERGEVRTSRICRIQATEKDFNTLTKLRSDKTIIQYIQPDTYKNMVVVKPWGYEYLILENECVAIWFVYVKKRFSTSMHSHPRKKSSLVLLSGTAMSNTFYSRHYLCGGDAVIYDAGVFHSTKAVSDEGIYLLEIETPPDKTDLVRLEDRYGRGMAGYESITEMQTENLHNYGYFFFEEPDAHQKSTYVRERFMITFEAFSNNQEFQRNFRLKQNELCTLCRGRFIDESGNIALDVGETQNADFLNTLRGLKISEKTLILKTATKER